MRPHSLSYYIAIAYARDKVGDNYGTSYKIVKPNISVGFLVFHSTARADARRLNLVSTYRLEFLAWGFQWALMKYDSLSGLVRSRNSFFVIPHLTFCRHMMISSSVIFLKSVCHALWRSCQSFKVESVWRPDWSSLWFFFFRRSCGMTWWRVI